MSLKVLLADDSMTAQNMAKKILTDSGYEVTTVSNGAAAVKKIAELKPDLVILDIYMPGYTGLEVCERVRANLETSRLPVLLTVGKLEPYRPEDGARVRADGIIVKPFEATDLLGIVKKISEKFIAVEKTTPVEEAVPDVKEPEPEYEESQTSERMEVPAEMAVAPAMEFEEMQVAEPAPAAFQWAPSTEVTDAVPHGFAAPALGIPGEPAAEVGTVTDSIPAYIEPEFAEKQVPGFEPTAEPASASPDVAPLADVEFNSVPQVEVSVDAATELEPEPDLGEISASAQDPALVTEPTEITQFATTFGVADAEEVPVGTVTGNESFFETASEDALEPLNAADVFGAPAPGLEVATEDALEEKQEQDTVVAPEPEEPAIEPKPVLAGEPLDDFEARVAAAMSAFDQPLQDSSTPAESEPIVEQVDTFVGDSEIVNPVGVESEFLEGAPVPEPEGKTELVPEPENRPAVDVDETMVLPSEALLSLEAEMRKSMGVNETTEFQPTGFSAAGQAESSFDVEPEIPAILQEEPALEALPPIGHDKEADLELPVPEPQPEIAVAPALAMAAAAAAVPSMEKWNGFGEEKLASAVQTAVERLKPQLIAEIVKALKGNE